MQQIESIQSLLVISGFWAIIIWSAWTTFSRIVAKPREPLSTCLSSDTNCKFCMQMLRKDLKRSGKKIRSQKYQRQTKKKTRRLEKKKGQFQRKREKKKKCT